jgi:hypothetical protein
LAALFVPISLRLFAGFGSHPVRAPSLLASTALLTSIVDSQAGAPISRYIEDVLTLLVIAVWRERTLVNLELDVWIGC